jgi:raffinose/stachyose/melibiose transport system permease protein
MKKSKKIIFGLLIIIITILMVFPLLWMFMLSFKTNAEILTNPIAPPATLRFDNYKKALQTLDYLNLYKNTALICVLALILELICTYLSSFVIARMHFNNKRIPQALFNYLIMGLAVSPFILLFPVYRIDVLLGLSGKWALVFSYAASSVSFNSLLLTNYLKQLPKEIDEAAIIDGCNIWHLISRVILPMSKPVLATVIIFNVLYIWNEFPYASVLLRDITDYTLSMGASFFKGTYTVDYGGIVASSVMIIIPELIFYGLFQKNIVGGMTAGAIKE